MWYRIINDNLYDYADYEYCDDCIELKDVTMDEYNANPIKYVVSNNKLVLNLTYAEDKAKEREKTFKQQFFKTSLGWIRRNVNMKDGSTKDFLADLLLPIKTGLELGQNVEIITYKTPDFALDYTDEYIISLQERKQATAQFIQECLMQVVEDFEG